MSEVSAIASTIVATAAARMITLCSQASQNFIDGIGRLAKSRFKQAHKILTLLKAYEIISGVSIYTLSSPLAALSTFLNNGSGASWTLGSNPSVAVGVFDGTSKKLYSPYSFVSGVSYAFSYTLNVTVGGPSTVAFLILDSSFSIIGETDVAIGNGINSGVVNITPIGTGAYVALVVNGTVDPDTTPTLTLTAFNKLITASSTSTFSPSGLSDGILYALRKLSDNSVPTLYPVLGTQTNVTVIQETDLPDGVVIDVGNYDASSNLFPETGGTGLGGLVEKGNEFDITVDGTLGGVFVGAGSIIRAKTNNPGQVLGNWRIFL